MESNSDLLWEKQVELLASCVYNISGFYSCCDFKRVLSVSQCHPLSVHSMNTIARIWESVCFQASLDDVALWVSTKETQKDNPPMLTNQWLGKNLSVNKSAGERQTATSCKICIFQLSCPPLPLYYPPLAMPSAALTSSAASPCLPEYFSLAFLFMPNPPLLSAALLQHCDAAFARLNAR